MTALLAIACITAGYKLGVSVQHARTVIAQATAHTTSQNEPSLTTRAVPPAATLTDVTEAVS